MRGLALTPDEKAPDTTSRPISISQLQGIDTWLAHPASRRCPADGLICTLPCCVTSDLCIDQERESAS
jgi:hypothetical protein